MVSPFAVTTRNLLPFSVLRLKLHPELLVSHNLCTLNALPPADSLPTILMFIADENGLRPFDLWRRNTDPITNTRRLVLKTEVRARRHTKSQRCANHRSHVCRDARAPLVQGQPFQGAPACTCMHEHAKGSAGAWPGGRAGGLACASCAARA
eukprot:6175933-Pleurochrysis_carterae.AAC.2